MQWSVMSKNQHHMAKLEINKCIVAASLHHFTGQPLLSLFATMAKLVNSLLVKASSEV
jgi:hypothetical protein